MFRDETILSKIVAEAFFAVQSSQFVNFGIGKLICVAEAMVGIATSVRRQE